MSKFNYFTYKEKRLEKFSQDEQEDLVFDLINAFSLANNPLDSALLLQDLLTEDEIKDLSKRLRIAKLLLEGQTHEEIVKEAHCSFATITKIRLWLDNAGEGLKMIIKKLPKRKKVYIPKRIPGFGYGLPNIIAHYASMGIKKGEQKRLEKFLQGMRRKTSADRDFKEELSSEFKKIKRQ